MTSWHRAWVIVECLNREIREKKREEERRGVQDVVETMDPIYDVMAEDFKLNKSKCCIIAQGEWFHLLHFFLLLFQMTTKYLHIRKSGRTLVSRGNLHTYERHLYIYGDRNGVERINRLDFWWLLTAQPRSLLSCSSRPGSGLLACMVIASSVLSRSRKTPFIWMSSKLLPRPLQGVSYLGLMDCPTMFRWSHVFPSFGVDFLWKRDRCCYKSHRRADKVFT